MTVYELMTILAKQPAGLEVVVSVAESDDREIVEATGVDDIGGVCLSIEWPPEEDDDE